MKNSEVNWQHIDTVLLDLDGTLLDLHFDNYFWLEHLPKRWAESQGRPEEECRSFLHGEFLEMRGSLNWYCLDYWSDRLDLDMVELKKEVAHKIALRPDALRFLEFLGTEGKEKILVTNGHRDGMNLKFSHTGIAGQFDQIVSCHDFQIPKEEQGFWRRLKAKHSFDNSRTLFVDDNESVLDSAQMFGIGQLLQIMQPDLQQPSRETGEFPFIHHFAEILP